jgi:AcrR family transcriptional regulator
MQYYIAMARPEPTTRERMVISAAQLIRERGARATSIDDVLAHSGAPRGSVYHHFPGGREQLIGEATAYAGDFIARRLDRMAEAGPQAALDRLVEMYRRDLLASDFRLGCPVLAVAIESRDDGSELQSRTGEIFDAWQGRIADGLTAAGAPRGRAGELAVLAVSAIEGALVLSRARRDIAPLDTVHDQLRALFGAALSDPPNQETA